MKLNTILSFFISLLFLACSSKHPLDPVIDFKPPRYVQELPPKIEEQNFNAQGSIFGQGNNPLFADRKAMYINDIVTVVISETTSSSSSAQKALTKTEEDTLGGGLFAPTGSASSLAKSVANVASGPLGIGFSTNSVGSFSGKGTNKRDEAFTTSITARVIKIMNNGNYFIEGRKEILIDNDKQIIQVSGVISPYNIDKTNSINSKYLSDAKIMYSTQGDIKQTTEQGWGTKFIKALWPF